MFFKNTPVQNKVRVKCDYCGNEFYRYPSQLAGKDKVYCSEECRWQIGRELNLRCDYCGNAFHRAPSEIAKWADRGCTQTYCSRECYDRARQASLPEGHRPAGRWGKHYAECIQCGKSMYLRPSRIHTDHENFCSMACRREFRLTHPERGVWAARKHSKQQHTTCQVCGLDELAILVTHHIDGNRKNNRQENLIVLCPNCHTRMHKV